MSDNKKRSRKSKLEVRDVDVEETENAILQSSDEEELLITFPSPEREQPTSQHETSTVNIDQPPLINLDQPVLVNLNQPPLANLDHTYALPNNSAPSAVPTTSSLPTISSTFSITSSSPSSSLQLSVKVEIEEVDETIFNETPSPKTNKKQKLHSINIFKTDIEEIYKISDEINLGADNFADELLSTEIKNVWGRILKPVEDNDPLDVVIQKALRKWNHSIQYGDLKYYGDSPLFYQCHICKLAWWYLTPFKEHITANHNMKIKIQYLENLSESYIVASDKLTKDIMYIPCEGNCYRCEKPYNFHVKPLNSYYICKKCNQAVETCTLLKRHELQCFSNPVYADKRNRKCTICMAKFYTITELNSHMITVHEVRSDIVTSFVSKNCSVCQRRYHYFVTHMCVKSMLSSSCEFCYRRFHTKTLQLAHHVMRVENYECKICSVILESKCMVTEHMLTHTDKFRMAYKCINFACPPTILFPDLDAVKLHKKLYHKQRIDKRRSYFDKVLIPEQCAKFESIQLLDGSDVNEGMRIEKIPQEPEEDWCVPNMENRQTDGQTDGPEQTDTQADQDDDVIIIKQEPQEPIVIDGQDDCEVQMDYAEMLSKVFKVSDAVRTSPIWSSVEIQTQIKVEPADTDFDNEVNVEKLITIKKEPTDDDSSVDVQTDSCQNRSQTGSRQSNSVYTLQYDSSQDGSQESNCQTGSHTDDIRIKTEHQDYEIDVLYNDGIAAINVDAKDIKQEMLDFTEANDYTGQNVLTAEAIFATEKGNEAKTDAKTTEKEITKFRVTSQKPVKVKNIVKTKLITNKSIVKTDNRAEDTEYDTKKAKSLKRKLSLSIKTEGPKNKTLKYDENGFKIRRLYKCSKCGYEQSHRLYSLHKKSCCQYSPSEKNKKVNTIDCTKCNTQFGSLKAYLIHFTKHGYGVLVCPSCNMKFELLKDLIPHFNQHVKMNYVNCWMINDGVDTTKKQQKCQTCRGIVDPAQLFSHWETHLELQVAKQEPQEVDMADIEVTATNKKELQPKALHLALQQLRSAARERDCHVCARRFTRRFDVKRHVIEHLYFDAYTKKDKRRAIMLRCQICLEEFLRGDHYKYHMREHGNLPVYRCEICDKAFSDSSNFAKHKKIHNMGVVICDICKKKFQAKTSLEKHMIIHLTTDPIPCKLCDRKFYSKSMYNKHYNTIHTRQCTMRCVVCDMKFSTSREKWDHAWEVHKERKFKADCPICKLEFRKFQDVRSHARTDHDVELSFYKIKSEGTMVKDIKFCQIKKHKDKSDTNVTLEIVDTR